MADSTPTHILAAQRVDGCPNCVYNTELPETFEPEDDGWLMTYTCSDCGHHWSTSWGRLTFDWSL